MINNQNKTVHIIFMRGYDPAKHFIPHVPGTLKCLEPTLKEDLENAGFNLNFSNDAYGLSNVAAIISWDLNQNLLHNIVKYPAKKCFLITLEPPVVAPEFYYPEIKRFFGNIYTLIDDLVDNKNYFKIHLPTARLKIIEDIYDYSQKKLCVLINSNKLFQRPNELYSERKKAISFLNDTGEFDLYGYGWQGISSWKGVARDDEKMNALRKYKFCICFENMKNQRGYVSEKIIECLAGGCVPIYYGASNIGDYVPKECFVDFREFDSYQKLYQFMKDMDRKTYESYLAAARRYFDTPAIQRHSVEQISQMLVNHVKLVQTI